jgi:hypothetical protein
MSHVCEQKQDRHSKAQLLRHSLLNETLRKSHEWNRNKAMIELSKARRARETKRICSRQLVHCCNACSVFMPCMPAAVQQHCARGIIL